MSRKRRSRRQMKIAWDLELAIASHKVDARMDSEWFDQHPGVTQRVRPATLLELAAWGAPPGTRVLTIRTADGTQLRVVLGRRARQRE
jgi:hypothetical protein